MAAESSHKVGLPKRPFEPSRTQTIKPRCLSDKCLLEEAEQTADVLSAISFDPKPPLGTKALSRRFSMLVEEIERRDLPISVRIERCRFMFPLL